MENAVVVVITKQGRYPYDYVALVSGKEKETMACDESKHKAALMALEKSGLIKLFDIVEIYEGISKRKTDEETLRARKTDSNRDQ